MVVRIADCDSRYVKRKYYPEIKQTSKTDNQLSQSPKDISQIHKIVCIKSQNTALVSVAYWEDCTPCIYCSDEKKCLVAFFHVM